MSLYRGANIAHKLKSIEFKSFPAAVEWLKKNLTESDIRSMSIRVDGGYDHSLGHLLDSRIRSAPPLSPCPHCGSIFVEVVERIESKRLPFSELEHGVSKYTVTCTNCKSNGPVVANRGLAATLWNHRSEQ